MMWPQDRLIPSQIFKVVQDYSDEQIQHLKFKSMQYDIRVIRGVLAQKLVSVPSKTCDCDPSPEIYCHLNFIPELSSINKVSLV